MTLYDTIGTTYSQYRKPDPRIRARIDAAIGDARSVVNVGAGTGSYEPAGAVAVEPSLTMIEQRADRSSVVRGVAGALPFGDGAFDAALAVMTVHHWPEPSAGLRELRRISRRQVVLTFDFHLHDDMWWVSEYLPELAEDWRHNASVIDIAAELGGRTEVVPVPWDCTDGLLVAHWRRPEQYLDPGVRASASGTALADQSIVERGVQRLAADLESGEWRRRHADLLDLEELDVGLRLIVAPC